MLVYFFNQKWPCGQGSMRSTSIPVTYVYTELKREGLREAPPVCGVCSFTWPLEEHLLWREASWPLIYVLFYLNASRGKPGPQHQQTPNWPMASIFCSDYPYTTLCRFLTLVSKQWLTLVWDPKQRSSCSEYGWGSSLRWCRVCPKL